MIKYIELYIDGNNIYVKFYKCFFCIYEIRRKRDVIRYIIVVYKKLFRYFGKIIVSLEIRVIKKFIDFVLNKVVKRGFLKDEVKYSDLKYDGIFNFFSKKYEVVDVGIEVKVIKNFFFYRCNKCGKVFVKKIYFEYYKKIYKVNVFNLFEGNKIKGRSIRFKVFVW